MAKFKSKAVEIDAWPVADILYAAAHAWRDLPVEVKELYDNGGVVFCSDSMSVPTLEGTMRADKDDWLIRGLKGEFYPCKPDVFAMKYEAVEEDDDRDGSNNDVL